jgi:hypothetical protein
MNVKEWMDKAELLHSTLRARATNDDCPYGDYNELREAFMKNSTLKPLLPEFIIKYRTLDYFWDFIKNKFQHYHERRAFLNEQFTKLYEYLESGPTALDGVISKTTEEFNEQYVHGLWQKALDRRESDPDGAITIARTLLEATCKHILDESGIQEPYKDSDDLPVLYNKAASFLNLSPSQHTEQQFKQILGGCVSIVNGLASIRNRISDAHGGGVTRVKPAPRHAALCVNVAGTMAMYLIETWENKKQMEGINDATS